MSWPLPACQALGVGGGRNAVEDLLDKTLQGVPNRDKIMDNDPGQEDNKAG